MAWFLRDRQFRLAALAVFAVIFAACEGTQAQEEPSFGDHWGDGLAEMNGYDLTYPRYGEMRTGRAVAVFVTETFSKAKIVKADSGQIPKDDELPVLKLNLVKEFPTGVYSYRLLTSVFAATDPFNGRPALTPVKITFSAQEWCGQVFSELLLEPSSARLNVNSYFLNESVRDQALPRPADGWTEDELLIRVRELRGPVLESGAKMEVPLLTSSEHARITHQPQEWRRATIRKSASPETVVVPAGRFSVNVWTIEPDGAPAWTICVERAYPRRIVRWSLADGETASLRGTTRMPYWKLHQNGDEKEREKFGLPRD